MYSVRSGNLQAREGLFHRHVPFVYALAQGLVGRHATPQAVCEGSFRLAFQLLRDRHAAVPNDLILPEAFRPWLAGVVVQVCHQATYRHVVARAFVPDISPRQAAFERAGRTYSSHPRPPDTARHRYSLGRLSPQSAAVACAGDSAA